MTRQVETKQTGLRGIMRSAPFVRGFNEARAGLPMDYEAYQERGQTNARWSYERGRMFGILWQGPLKNGHKVSFYAYDHMCHMKQRRLII